MNIHNLSRDTTVTLNHILFQAAYSEVKSLAGVDYVGHLVWESDTLWAGFSLEFGSESAGSEYMQDIFKAFTIRASHWNESDMNFAPAGFRMVPTLHHTEVTYANRHRFTIGLQMIQVSGLAE